MNVTGRGPRARGGRVLRLAQLQLPTTSGTTVQTADGRSFEIPGGARGSYPWVRQASLLANLHHDAGDDAGAYAWTREYNKRRLIWEQAQAGADLEALLAAGGLDLLAPFRLVLDVAGRILERIDQAGGAVIDWAKWLPWLGAGILAVAAYGFSRGGGLTVKR